MKYRKKPVTVDAYQWFKVFEYQEGVQRDVDYYRTPAFDGQRSCKYCVSIMHDHGWIDTREGGHIVCPGDWVITGVKGEKYPCKPDIFVETYTPVIEISDEALNSRLGPSLIDRLKASE